MRTAFILVALLAISGDEFAQGVKAYQEARYPDALAAFTAAEERAGHEASAALLYNRALAALQAGRLIDAEFSAEKAAARGSSEFVSLRDFVLGSASFVRCLRAEVEANLPEAEPTAYTRAIQAAEAALSYWQSATAGRDGWPAARRNAERVWLKLAELRRKQSEADANRNTKKEQMPEQAPPPLDPEPLEPELQPEQQPLPQQTPGVLTTEQLAAIFDKLTAKEQEKRHIRRAQQQRSSTRVEKDW